MKNIQPTADRILVEVIPEETTTKGGIVLTGESNHDKPRRGKIIAAGENVDPLLEVGKMILFTRAAFNQVEIESKELHFLIEEDIFCVFE